MQPVLTSSVKEENSHNVFKVSKYILGMKYDCMYIDSYWHVLNFMLWKCPYVVYLSVSLIIWLVLCNPLTIQVCCYVVVCVQTTRVTDWSMEIGFLCATGKNLSHVGVAVTYVALCTYWLCLHMVTIQQYKTE